MKSPVLIMNVFWKCLGRFVRKNSLNDGLYGFLKQVAFFFRLLRLLLLEKSFKLLSCSL